jgi:hypothetical protein
MWERRENAQQYDQAFNGSTLHQQAMAVSTCVLGICFLVAIFAWESEHVLLLGSGSLAFRSSPGEDFFCLCRGLPAVINKEP